jgi:hypothetical protein
MKPDSVSVDGSLFITPRVAVGVLSSDAQCQDMFIRRLNWHSCNLMTLQGREQSQHEFSGCTVESRLTGRRYDELHVLLTAIESASVVVELLPFACVVHIHHLGASVPLEHSGARQYQWPSLEDAAQFFAKLYAARECSLLVVDRSDELSWVDEGLVNRSALSAGRDCVQALERLMPQLVAEPAWRVRQPQLIVETTPHSSMATLAYLQARVRGHLGLEPQIHLLLSESYPECQLTWLAAHDNQAGCC